MPLRSSSLRCVVSGCSTKLPCRAAADIAPSRDASLSRCRQAGLSEEFRTSTRRFSHAFANIYLCVKISRFITLHNKCMLLVLTRQIFDYFGVSVYENGYPFGAQRLRAFLCGHSLSTGETTPRCGLKSRTLYYEHGNSRQFISVPKWE